MYTQEDLNKLIDQVEKEFTSHLAKTEELLLAKSEESEKEPKEDSEKEPKAEESEAPAAEAAPEAEEAAEAPEAAQEEPAAEAPADSEAPAQDGSGYDAEDLAHLEEMYSSMSFDELMAHHDAVKMALDAKSAEQAPAEAAPAAEAPAEMAPEAAPTEEAPMADSQEMHKSEAGSEVALLKSELEAQKAKGEELKKNFETVSNFLVSFVSKKVAPQGKAITNVETLSKSEIVPEEKALSKAEINVILKKKTAEQSLQKSDRELINAYYLKGASINSISHLLK